MGICAPPITIVPYLGIDQDNLVLYPLYNQDILLLQQRKKLVKYKPEISKKCPPAIFEFSGIAAILASAKRVKSLAAAFDSAELDLASHITDSATTFLDVAYNNQPISTVGQINHSKINLDRVFITIGNFKESPFYLTVGRRYVPFGQYYSYMITGPIVRIITHREHPITLIVNGQ